MPNISFAGHLSGIVAGTLQLYGFPLIPSEAYLRRMDEWAAMRSLTSFPSFVATTSLSIGRNQSASGSSFDGCHAVQNYLTSVMEACTTALFGRGHAENANIRLGRVEPESTIDLILTEEKAELSQIV